MTSDMAFECLLVSQDPAIFSTVSGILRDLSVCMDVCLTSAKASRVLAKSSTDLLVIDWEGAPSSELLDHVWALAKWHKPTVVAISPWNCQVPRAHVVLQKPVTRDSGAKSLKIAYSKMLMDYRRHARHTLSISVMATDESNKTIPITVINIGDGGVGLSTDARLTIGETISFRLFLPEATRDIFIQARILWTLENGRAGCEFLRIPPVDLQLLFDWLKEKIQIKKPLIEI